MGALIKELIRQMLVEIPDLDDDPSTVELLEASVGANVTEVVRLYAAMTPPAGFDAPPEALEYARRLAQRGTPLTALLRAYRLGQASFQEFLLKTIGEVSQDPDDLVAASQYMQEVAFSYVDRVSEQVVAAFETERDSWVRNRSAIRSSTVAAILAGAQVDPGDAERTLGYALHGKHQGVVAWIDPGLQVVDRLNRIERAIAKLAEHLGVARGPLVIPPDESTAWAWLPGTATTDPGSSPAWLTDELVWIALGQPAVDVDGFRLTHRQARQSHAVAVAADTETRTRVTRSADVGLIALMTADLEAVRSWVAATLGGLAVDDEANARLRDTVRAFLSTGGSLTAAAQQLLLHKNTVQYRIRRAEQIRGRPLEDGRLDVEVALLAARWFGSKVLQPRT